jgi:hypothetical protein
LVPGGVVAVDQPPHHADDDEYDDDPHDDVHGNPFIWPSCCSALTLRRVTTAVQNLLASTDGGIEASRG